MTIAEIKRLIRRTSGIPDLLDLVCDHDRLERENAELRRALEQATSQGRTP